VPSRMGEKTICRPDTKRKEKNSGIKRKKGGNSYPMIKSFSLISEGGRVEEKTINFS